MARPKSIIEVAHIDGVNYPITIADDLDINPTDLETEFCNQADCYRRYGELAEIAQDEAERYKVELGRLYATVDERVRIENAISNQEAKKVGATPVRMTEKMVENCVITDPEYIKQQLKYFEARKQAGVLKVYKEAMQHRLQMLIGIGANYRAEGQADPVLLREAVKQRYRQKEAEKRQQQNKESTRTSIRKPVGKKST